MGVIKEFFYLQKSDRKVMLFLLVVAVAAVLLVYGISGASSVGDDAEGDTLAVRVRGGGYATFQPRRQYVGAVPQQQQGELFPFDPNTADSTTLLRLGLSPRIVRNIYKYRAAGGTFRQPTDFAQLYGLSAGQYRQLEPYIHISDDYLPAAQVIERVPITQRRDTVMRVVKAAPGEQIALNAADTTLLKRVPGIGSYFARQIVSYRDRLGGYIDVSQLREIEGFPEEALAYFVLGNATIRKLNVNTATLNQLKRHPYINFYQARAIVDYRRLRKPIATLEELRLLKDFAPSDIERLSPYVEF